MTYSYDADQRELGETWKAYGGSVTDVKTFTYDNVGNQLTAADYNGAYTYTYDADNRVSTVAEPFGLSMTFSYNAVGNRTSVVDSLGGVQTSTYDADNNLQTREQTGNSGTLRIDYTYTPDNQVATIKDYSNLAGTTLVAETDDTYNADNLMSNQQDRNGSATVYLNTTYSYDADSRLTTRNQ